MPITTREPVMVFRETKNCPCGSTYVATGTALLCYPALYLHKCNDCGDTAQFNDNYPRLVYQTVGEQHEPIPL